MRVLEPEPKGPPSTAPEDSSMLWERILPFEFWYLRKYIITRPRVKTAWYRVMYFLACFLYIYSILALFAVRVEAVPTSDPAYAVMFLIQALLYVLMPFVSFRFVDDILLSDDVPLLFSEAMQFDPRFQWKFQAFAHFNFSLALVALTVYSVLSEFGVLSMCTSIFFTTLFFTPYVYAYSLLLVLLEAYRLQATKFISDLKSKKHDYIVSHSSSDVEIGGERMPQSNSTGPFGSDMELINRYYTLHSRCLYTSEKRGKEILCIFLSAIVTAVGSAYGALTRQFSFLSIFLFTLIAILVVLQIGMSMATVNEMGTLVCRELCTYHMHCLCHGNANNCSATEREVTNRFFNLIVYSKFEIYFFGNFALRSKTLIAILGSITAAIIPSIIIRVM